MPDDVVKEKKSDGTTVDVAARGRVAEREQGLVWKIALRFILRQPEFGVLFVVLVVWQILQDTLKDTSQAASFIWFALLCIGAVSILKILNFLLNIPSGSLRWFKIAFLVTVTTCFLVPLAALAYTLATTIVRDDGNPSIVAERVGALVARIFKFSDAGPDLKAENPSVAEPPISSQVVPPANKVNATSPYSKCIESAHEAGKPEDIIACVKFL